MSQTRVSQRSIASVGTASVTSLGATQTFGTIAMYKGVLVSVKTVEKPINFQIDKKRLIELKQVCDVIPRHFHVLLL